MAVPALGVDDTDSGKEQVDAASSSRVLLCIVGGAVLSSIGIAFRLYPKTSTRRAELFANSKRYEAGMKILERIREKRTMPNESNQSEQINGSTSERTLARG